jgi:hypothetical protein
VSAAGESWDESALAETLKDSFGAGSDVDMPDEIRFLHGVAKLGRRYFQDCEDDERGLSVFILHPDRPGELGRPTEYVPMLRNGRQSLSKRIWLTTHRVNESFAVDMGADESDGDVWTYVKDELGFGDLPTVVVDSRDGKTVSHFYPGGLNKPQLEEERDLTLATIDRDSLYEAINSIYMDDLKTPDAQGEANNVWANAARGFPSDKAEKFVQRVLKVGLTRAFPDFVIRPEQPQSEGRTDLEIEQQFADDPTSVTRHFILEIKVLRESSDTGKTKYGLGDTEDAIRKGLGQAVVYRDNKPARDAVVCSFDTRKDYSGAAVYDFIRDEAVDKAIALWVWHLFNSSEEMRKRLMAGEAIGGEQAC